MIDDSNRQLFAEAILGKDAAEFFFTDIGRYVTGCALQVVEKADIELREVDPEDSKRIRELQNEIKVAGLAIKWLNEQIQKGQMAEQQLEAEREMG